MSVTFSHYFSLVFLLKDDIFVRERLYNTIQV